MLAMESDHPSQTQPSARHPSANAHMQTCTAATQGIAAQRTSSERRTVQTPCSATHMRFAQIHAGQIRCHTPHAAVHVTAAMLEGHRCTQTAECCKMYAGTHSHTQQPVPQQHISVFTFIHDCCAECVARQAKQPAGST